MFVAVFEAGMHGTHENPVFQGSEAEVEGGEEVGVTAHMLQFRTEPA